MILPCLAGRSMITLDARGEVYPCEMLEQLAPRADPGAGIPSWSMGSLRESGYETAKVITSDPARRIRDWIKAKKCFCGFECAAYNNLVFNARQWPAILLRRPL